MADTNAQAQAARSLPPVPVGMVVMNAAMGTFFLMLNVVDMSILILAQRSADIVTPAAALFHTLSPHAAVTPSTSLTLLHAWSMWKANQPLIPYLLQGFGLMLPFGVYRLFTSDAWPLLTSRAHAVNIKRHVYGACTLVALISVLYCVLGVAKPLEAQLAVALKDANGSFTATIADSVSQLLSVYGCLCALNGFMLLSNVGKYRASLTTVAGEAAAPAAAGELKATKVE